MRYFRATEKVINIYSDKPSNFVNYRLNSLFRTQDFLSVKDLEAINYRREYENKHVDDIQKHFILYIFHISKKPY